MDDSPEYEPEIITMQDGSIWYPWQLQYKRDV